MKNFFFVSILFLIVIFGLITAPQALAISGEEICKKSFEGESANGWCTGFDDCARTPKKVYSFDKEGNKYSFSCKYGVLGVLSTCKCDPNTAKELVLPPAPTPAPIPISPSAPAPAPSPSPVAPVAGTGGGNAGSGGGTTRTPPACEGKNLPIKEPKFYVGYIDGNKNNKYEQGETQRGLAYDGLVPCGKCVVETNWPPTENDKKLASGPGKYVSCQFCHLQIMFSAIINFLLFMVIVPVAVLFIVIGGLMYVFSAGDQARINKAKSMIIGVSIGLAIVFGAWMIINVFFSLIGLSQFSMGLTGPGNWFTIPCDIKL